MSTEYTIKSHKAECEQSLKRAISSALEVCGGMAEDYAADLAPVRNGHLSQSIQHTPVGDNEMKIYTTKEYAIYVEKGTGKFVAGGRGTPWHYQDENGNWYTTSGQPPQAFLEPALKDHAEEYVRVFEKVLGALT